MADETPDDDAPVPASLADRAGALLGVRVTDAVDLGGSERSEVQRLTLDDGRTVVAKRFLSADSGFEREHLGLMLLGQTPELLAVDEPGRLVVMSDLGDRPTLADLLLGEDRDAAWDGALTWAAALGDLVGATLGTEAEQARATLPPDEEDFDLSAAVRAGARALAELVGQPGEACRDGLDRIDGVLSASSSTDVLWPGDACPDNAVLTRDGWRFLDLEGASVVPAALVAAYPALPFATCWCVLDPPEGFTGAMSEAFDAALARHAPWLTSTPDWRGQVRLGGALWVLAMTGWLLPRAHSDDGPIGPVGRLAPSRRQHLAARWRWLATTLRAEAPDLAALGEAASDWANEHWADDVAGIGGYPAFAAGGA